MITFQGQSVKEIHRAFQESVDVYLEWCKERGKLAEKPFSGKFVVLIPPALHRSIFLSAKQEGKSLNKWIEEYLTGSFSVVPDDSITQHQLKN